MRLTLKLIYFLFRKYAACVQLKPLLSQASIDFMYFNQDEIAEVSLVVRDRLESNIVQNTRIL